MLITQGKYEIEIYMKVLRVNNWNTRIKKWINRISKSNWLCKKIVEINGIGYISMVDLIVETGDLNKLW